MKNLILSIVFVLVSLTSFSQEKKYDTTQVRSVRLEKLVFKYINEYRVSLGRKPVKWDDKIYTVAAHHCHYLSFRGIKLSHFENEDRPNHTEVRYLCDRIRYFNIDSKESIENITSSFTLSLNTDADYERVARDIVNAWINSIAHKNAMTQYNLEAGAVAIYVVEGQWMRPVLVMTDYH